MRCYPVESMSSALWEVTKGKDVMGESTFGWFRVACLPFSESAFLHRKGEYFFLSTTAAMSEKLIEYKKAIALLTASYPLRLSSSWLPVFVSR